MMITILAIVNLQINFVLEKNGSDIIGIFPSSPEAHTHWNAI